MRFTIFARGFVCPFVVTFCLAIAGLAPAQTIPNYNPSPSILHTWTSNESPSQGRLAKDASGNIYGYNMTTVNSGGTYTFYGFLFKLTNLQNGSYSYSVPFTFPSNYSLYNTASPVLDSSGNIFGTAFDKNNTSSPGVLFELANSGGNYIFRILYTFVQGVDAPPNRLMMDASGNLYGATPAQLTCCTAGSPTVTGYGNVYEFVNNNGTYTKKVLYNYSASNNAAGSFGLLAMDAAGNLFDIGDEADYSTEDVVELVRGADGSYSERLLYRATNQSANLFAPLTLDANDNIFLATNFISGSSNGAVLELVNSGGNYSLQTLYSFTGGADGGYPLSPLVFDASGNLYGTTRYGGNAAGSNGAGTVFALVPGSSGYQLKTVYTLNGTTDGGAPESGILFDQNYNIFAVTNGFYDNASQTHTPPAIFELLNQSANSTTTTVAASPSSVGLATPVTLTATVAPASGGSLPSGTVTFTEGNITLGSAQLSSGTAALTLTSDFLGLGTNTITATFTASGGNTGANSSGVTTVTVSESNLAQISGGNTFSGNQNINGSVTASSFAGDGSGLTNVTASALNCFACVTNSQLGVNYAGSSTQGGPATSAITAQTALTAGSATSAATAANAAALGGLPASAYALAGSNNFTGSQTITGNVTSTGVVTAQSASFSSGVTTNSVTIGGGTTIQGYFSVTIPVTLPALRSGACISYQSAAIAGFTPGDTDTFAIGAPSALTAALHAPGDKDDEREGDHSHAQPALFLTYQAWETTTSANPAIGLQVCNPSDSPYRGGFTGNFRVDIFKH